MIEAFERLSDRLLSLVVPTGTAAAITCWKAIDRCTGCTRQGGYGQRVIRVECCSNGDCYYTTYGRCCKYCMQGPCS